MPTASQRTKPLGLFHGKPAPRLYDHLIEVLRVRHYSPCTDEAYGHWTGRYIDFNQHQHPRALAESDGNRFLTHLAVKELLAASSRNGFLREPHVIPSPRTCRLTPRTFARSKNCSHYKDVRTTMIYTQVLKRGGRAVRSPADVLARRSDEC